MHKTNRYKNNTGKTSFSYMLYVLHVWVNNDIKIVFFFVSQILKNIKQDFSQASKKMISGLFKNINPKGEFANLKQNKSFLLHKH